MDEIKTVDIKDKDYPNLLRKIKNPPRVLYVKGKMLPNEPCFAIVGTRRFSSYGKQAALEIAVDLSEAGLTIVSGLAPGIDTFAHLSVIEGNGRTIAVLGTGIDKKSIYPQLNLKLSEKIIDTNGALVSEYMPGTRGTKFTFPQRNRIIAGLSIGILVIEAKEKSGALITADYALSQNRKLFAIPGSIYSSNSRGPNNLIKNGAKLVENANDILKELNLPLANKVGKITGETEEENLILEALKEESLYIDKIIERTKLQAPVVSGILTILEIKRKIKNLGGGIYAISHS